MVSPDTDGKSLPVSSAGDLPHGVKHDGTSHRVPLETRLLHRPFHGLEQCRVRLR